VQTVASFTPSMQLLLGKLVKIGLFTLAILVALRSVGIDLTAFAVFSGAVGVGIGFGLQAVFSNFVAGLILLLEGSLKVGDFVDLESGVTGEVREINIRSTVITTNDNIDILVPNSEFMNGRVTNWTLRDAYRRYRVPFGVAYASDLELVREAALEAAGEVEHTLHGNPRREPQVWLVGFGDSSLDFELVVWLTPEAGKRPARVHADYCWALAHALRRHHIEIPFPQRDLHLKPPAELNVSLNGGGIRLAPGEGAKTQPAPA
jgi:small-conductance mechanosensitive channel